MIKIQENSSLKPLTTFGVEANARYFVEVSDEKELKEIFSQFDFTKTPFLILGGGSNLLFTKDFDGYVIAMCTKGIEKISENGGSVLVRAKAGENWHNFVLHCLENGWNGLENLAAIPGNVGASPVQNIGAYGREIKDVMHELRALDLHTMQEIVLSNADCKFGYRDSIFKHEKNRYIVLSVTFELSKKSELHVEYGAIQKELETRNIKTPTSKNIAEIVEFIRENKLPNPKELGSAGSFFKNPMVSKAQYEDILESFPNIVAYSDGNLVKLGAGWMIEQCGFKDFRQGDAGVYEKQALVLVNHGTATGKDIVELYNKIRNAVFQKFGVEIEVEVNIL